MNRREWAGLHLGDPNYWSVDDKGVIRDSFRRFDQQVVGTVISREGGIATIRWKASGTQSEVEDWDDDGE